VRLAEAKRSPDQFTPHQVYRYSLNALKESSGRHRESLRLLQKGPKTTVYFK
jgi:hypothetical protein